MIPLEKAVLCVGCEVVSDSHGEYCPHCGNKGLLNLAAVLNRAETLSDDWWPQFVRESGLAMEMPMSLDPRRPAKHPDARRGRFLP